MNLEYYVGDQWELDPLCQGCKWKDIAIAYHITDHSCTKCRAIYNDANREECENDINQRLYDNIGFLNVMILLASKRKDQKIEMPVDNMKILRDILKDCKERIVRG